VGDGYWGASMLKEKSGGGDFGTTKFLPQQLQQQPTTAPEADFWHCNVIPVGPFLEILKVPEAFAAALEKKGLEVIKDWQEINKDVKNPKNRVLSEKQFVLQSHSFRGARGAIEHSQIEFQLTSYAYNLNAQKVAKPEAMHLRDIKVVPTVALSLLLLMQFLKFMIKVKSTVHARGRSDPASLDNGATYDPYG